MWQDVRQPNGSPHIHQDFETHQGYRPGEPAITGSRRLRKDKTQHRVDRTESIVNTRTYQPRIVREAIEISKFSHNSNCEDGCKLNKSLPSSAPRNRTTEPLSPNNHTSFVYTCREEEEEEEEEEEKLKKIKNIFPNLLFYTRGH
jgi:hypothetical protein